MTKLSILMVYPTSH